MQAIRRKKSHNAFSDQSAVIHLLLKEEAQGLDAGSLDGSESKCKKALALAPKNADAYYLLGLVHARRGHFDEAAVLFQKGAVLQPSSPYTHNAFGNACAALGRLDEAVAAFRKAIGLDSASGDAWYNLANAYAVTEQNLLAEECYRRAIDLHPQSAIVYNNLGAVLKKLGRLGEAVEQGRQAVHLAPHDAKNYYNLGASLQASGLLREAKGCYEKALALDPKYGKAYFNLGTALLELQRPHLAVAAFLRAATLEDDKAESYCQAGIAYLHFDKTAEAANHFFHALTADPNHARSRQQLCFCIRQSSLVSHDQRFSDILLNALAEAWDRPENLARTVIENLRTRPFFRDWFVTDGQYAIPGFSSFTALFADQAALQALTDPLFLAALCNTVLPDCGMESLLTALRQAMLAAVLEGQLFDEKMLGFCTALSCQCFHNEYVFAVSTHEDEAVARLTAQFQSKVDSSLPLPVEGLLALSCYRPLSGLAGADRLFGGGWPEVIAPVLERQIQGPLQEREILPGICRLTGIHDHVSGKVQAQYAENPYPRWIRLPAFPPPVPLREYLSALFPLQRHKLQSLPDSADILVAGCGTGRHPIEIACFYDDVTILAVDLSPTSLAYAIRKAKEAGLDSISFAQADLLELNSIGRRFDCVESVGVLHHLADPEEGLRSLLGLLKPQGTAVMKIGLYSEIAREPLRLVREYIRDRCLDSTPAGIRSCRKAVAFPPDPGLNAEKITKLTDFFSASECRDLLFHVQEHRFTLPQIGRLCSKLGLTFLGISITREIAAQYAADFPDDPAMTNLDNWHDFEGKNPDTFWGMYQFWVCREPKP